MEVIPILMLLLHDPGGHEVLLNPAEIVSMRAAIEGRKNELVHGGIKCVIATTDGKLVNVVETCDSIKAQAAKHR